MNPTNQNCQPMVRNNTAQLLDTGLRARSNLIKKQRLTSTIKYKTLLLRYPANTVANSE